MNNTALVRRELRLAAKSPFNKMYGVEVNKMASIYRSGQTHALAFREDNINESSTAGAPRRD